MRRTIFTAFLITLVAGATAAAQMSTPTSSSTQGAFDKLSLGNQKIAQALCNAQPGGCPSGASTPTASTSTTQPKTLDQIAAMKQHRGWGEIFKQMKEQGLVQEKNLGQVISHANRQAHTGSSSGTMITNGSGRTQVMGRPDSAGKGRGRSENEAMDDRGANAGRGSDSSGPGRGYGYGRGDGSTSSAGGGFGSHGG